MGLDQFAYSIDSEGDKTEIACWRKHPNLQGWMENLWHEKDGPNETEETSGGLGFTEFNCVSVELSYENLDALESAITNSKLPSTTGFFFGNNSDDYYKEKDLEFIQSARLSLDSGNKVYYDSSW